MAVTWKKLAYLDEVATLSDEDPHDIGTVAAEGVAMDASRHDHVHRLGNGAVDVAAVLASDVVDGTKIADDAVGSEHIEPLSAKLQCSRSHDASPRKNLLQDRRHTRIFVHCNSIIRSPPLSWE